jgi:hypothetical protein
MGILIGVLVVAFIVGLLSRSKGDGFLDTLSAGCGQTMGCLILIVIIIGIAIYASANS